MIVMFCGLLLRYSTIQVNDRHNNIDPVCPSSIAEMSEGQNDQLTFPYCKQDNIMVDPQTYN